MGGASAPTDLRTTVTSAAALTCGVLPVFLLGASSDAIRAELGVGEAAVGAVVTALFLAAGVSATPVGRLTERLGSGRALRAGVLTSGMVTAAIGLLAHDWWHLVVLVVPAGVAVAAIDTGAARAFADVVSTDRQGAAFGVKEASVPAASLLAGLALPTLATWFGWRASFVVAPVAAAAVLATLPRGTGGPSPPAVDAEEAATGRVPPGRGLVALAVAVGIGAGAATAATTFLVPAATARGTATSAAGVLLAVASAASVVTRVAVGRWADRPTARPRTAIALMLTIGAAGAVLLAVGAGVAVVTAGALLVVGAGWGWTGLAFLAAVRAAPGAAATAAGTVLTGLATGGALGPVAFGWVVGATSYGPAWVAVAVALAVGGAVAAVGGRPATPRTRGGE